MKQFSPTIKEIIRSEWKDLKLLKKAWEGLGYYSRGNAHMQKASSNKSMV